MEWNGCSAQSETTEVNTDEFTRTIINLKDAALQFGRQSAAGGRGGCVLTRCWNC